MTGRMEACIRLTKNIKIKGKIILDIGCSYPWFCNYSIKSKAKKVYGIDPDPSKISIAQKQAPKAIISLGHAGELHFKDGSINVVSLFDVIEHVPVGTENIVFSEINRVLRPSGVLLLSTPYDYWLSKITDPAWYIGHRHYSVENLKDMLENAGFEVTYLALHGWIWEIIGMAVLYISKWILHRPMLFEEWIDKRRREEFKRPGKTHIFLIAQKVT